jgi:branched-chain amino acid transport system substrate-binding protein
VIAWCLVAFVAAGCGARFKDNGTTVAGNQVSGIAGDQSATGDAAGGETGTTSVGGAAGSTGGVTGTTVAGARAGGRTAVNAPTDTGIGSTQGVTATEIKIGYLLALSGAAPVPTSFDKGANVYWKYINDHGGINGRKVNLVIRDTKSDANTGRDEAKAMVETEKVFAVVVLDRLENQEAIGNYLDDRKMPNIEIQTPANLSRSKAWTFGVTIDHQVQGSLIADYFVKVLKAQKPCLVYENTPALAPGRDAFKGELTKLGSSAAYVNAVGGHDNDYSNTAQGIFNAKCDAVWLYMAPEPAAKIANQADPLIHPVWFANSISWGFDLTFKAGATALRGARAFSPWLPLNDPRTAAYKQAYRTYYTSPSDSPDDIGIVGWGVGEIVGEALTKAGKDLGQNAFRTAFQNLNYKPDIWAPLAFSGTIREGANVIAVLKAMPEASPDHWELDRDFTGAF